MGVHRAALVDRDGTLCRDVPYCSRPEDLELLPGAGEGVRLLNEASFKVILITNQSGVARGYFTTSDLARIHEKLKRSLARRGGRLDGLYCCPHHPQAGCACRKPRPHLAHRAAEDHDLDLSRSYVIGDRAMDMELADRAGCAGGLLIQARGAKGEAPRSNVPTFPSFLDAARWLIAHGFAPP